LDRIASTLDCNPISWSLPQEENHRQKLMKAKKTILLKGIHSGIRRLMFSVNSLTPMREASQKRQPLKREHPTAGLVKGIGWYCAFFNAFLRTITEWGPNHSANIR
jgi:hypothetical protein